ncbi:hypothetical protein POVWA2_058860 [Plasmodium ovale wallikeri]|uniref:Uncharacterized protein n=1 Tax=Plasmodium ovale wallikeri TaxID=864142 RepID=A0A1A8ZZW3_PLAOA|nr:hypothetical protein POVWA1_059530 [Plasmodium ovale wallikeri]SBT49827.1 hypothetical protein POVWA2_058860 [Plasmodium ovale wallikeri]
MLLATMSWRYEYVLYVLRTCYICSKSVNASVLHPHITNLCRLKNFEDNRESLLFFSSIGRAFAYKNIPFCRYVCTGKKKAQLKNLWHTHECFVLIGRRGK